MVTRNEKHHRVDLTLLDNQNFTFELKWTYFPLLTISIRLFQVQDAATVCVRYDQQFKVFAQLNVENSKSRSLYNHEQLQVSCYPAGGAVCEHVQISWSRQAVNTAGTKTGEQAASCILCQMSLDSYIRALTKTMIVHHISHILKRIWVLHSFQWLLKTFLCCSLFISSTEIKPTF